MADSTPPQPGASSAAPSRPIWKRVALNHWTPVFLGLALFGLHGWWFAGCASWLPRAEVVSGYGATLIVLGLLVAARPFIETGVLGMARQSVPIPYLGMFATSTETTMRAAAAHQQRVTDAIPGVVAERIIAVLVVALGTLVNGYGGWIARLISWAFRLEICPA